MNIINIHTGISIALQYYDNHEGYHMRSEQDQITLDPTDTPMSDDDVKRMRSLGWFQFGGNYNSANSWNAII